jgi:signal transduction histidine kinase
MLYYGEFKRFNGLIKAYFFVVLIRVFIAIVYPEMIQNNPDFHLIYRILTFGISFVFYYYLYLNIGNNYFKFLFLASTILIIVVFLTIVDATINNDTNTFTGIILIFTGIILDNLCFVAAFTYQIITIDREKKNAEITHQEQLSTVQLEMQQQTMQHIGREIHDNVGQKLTLASLYTQQLAYENKAPLIKSTIENISDIINQSLNELRQLSKSLTDNNIEVNTLHALLELECEKCNEIKKCKINFSSDSKEFVLPYQIKSVLLRISQEFIQNSIKHSNCKNINVTLNNANNNLHLSLYDDGKGFDINENSHGIGLKNIKKRIEIIGGKYVFESQQNTGTKLLIEIPL